VGDGKILIVILCGAGDRPIPDLGGRTPLEHARTRHLDALARRGATRLVTVIDDDVAPESDSGAMALLGYDPLVYYTGRGPLEGLGMGFWDESQSCVAFRINFGSCDRASGRLDRRTARDLDDAELQALARDVRAEVALDGFPGISYELVAFGRHRGILCLRSSDRQLSGNVSNTDPGFRKLRGFGVPNRDFRAEPAPCVPLEEGEAAALTARLVDAFVAESSRVLERSEVNAARRAAGRLPGNVILFRDGGHELPELPSFEERSGGRTLALYGQVPAEHGLCRLIGGRFVETRPREGQSDEAFYREAAFRAVADPADVVLVHLKGADEPGHDDLPLEKAQAIEAIDECFVGTLVEAAGAEDVLVATGDHATPCGVGIHVPDPVPTAVAGPRVPRDESTGFSEAQAARGGLPVDRACELLPYLIDGARR
jgi:2,3-bisphosphoglycerate-independent phosphoglycerate mutase